MRYFVVLLLLCNAATAEVAGIKPIFKEAPSQPSVPLSQSGQLVVGEKLAAVFLLNKPLVYTFDGQKTVLPMSKLNGFCFAGPHAYAGDYQDIKVYDTKEWQELGARQKDGKGLAQLAATPDGRMIFARYESAPAQIRYYLRDSETGKLSLGRCFVESELTLVRARLALAPSGRDIEIAEESVRVDYLSNATDMKFSHDGKHLFVPCYESDVLVFERDDDEWKHFATLRDGVMGRVRYGLPLSRCAAVSGDDLFVGGVKGLSRLRFDGKVFTANGWWVDDKEAFVRPDHVLPCIESITSMAVSKNGKFLFLASRDNTGVAVLEIGEDLRLNGFVGDDSKVFDVALSNDGTKLFAKSKASQLLIYDLDERFTE